jgi:S1-C subfamily serine protease
MPLPTDQATNPGPSADPTAPWPRPAPPVPPAPAAPWPHQAPPAPPVAGDPRYGGQPPYGPSPYGGQPPYGAGPYRGAPWGTPPPPVPPSRRRGGAGTLVVVFLVTALLVGGLVVAGGRLVGLTTEAVSPRRAVPTSPASPLPTVPPPGSGSGSPSAGGTTSPATVAAAVSPGIVNIVSRVSAGVGAGTGMILTADGRILTNNHVVEGASQIAVTTVADGKTYRATVVGTNPGEDVAVIQLADASGLTTIPLGNSDDVEIGDDVVALGNAGGQGGDPDVAPGSVTALDQEITATDQNGGNAETLTGLIQVAADVQPGDSGGPLADADGKVIGMDTAASAGQGRYRTVVHQGYAIPINHALDVAKELVAHPNGSASGSGNENGSGGRGTTGSAGHLGVAVQPAATGGAEIAEVEPGSAADDAGLEPGDVITAVDGTAVRAPADLTAALKGHAAGSPVTLTWTGADGRHRAAVTLG